MKESFDRDQTLGIYDRSTCVGGVDFCVGERGPFFAQIQNEGHFKRNM